MNYQKVQFLARVQFLPFCLLMIMNHCATLLVVADNRKIFLASASRISTQRS